MLETFQDVGQDLFLTGLVSSHTGTMSIRTGEGLMISRPGARLGHLTPEDLLSLSLDDESDEIAEDAGIHRAVYRGTDAGAVIHARPPATMALALIEDRLSPANGEGAEILGSAPVLISQRPLDSPDMAQLVARSLKESRIVALRGQGVFARGKDLADALHMVSLLEEMCKVVQIFRTLSREEVQPPGRDFQERRPDNFRGRNDFRGGGHPTGSRPPQQRGSPTGPRRTDGPPHRTGTGPQREGGRRPPPHR